MTDSTEVNALDLKDVQDRVRKRENIKGPRQGDFVVLLCGTMARMTGKGIGRVSSWVGGGGKLPIDATPDVKNPNRVSHLSLATDHFGDGRYYICRDGTVSYSGANKFHDMPATAKLLVTPHTELGEFCVFEMGHPVLGISRGNLGCVPPFKLPCRVFQLVK